MMVLLVLVRLTILRTALTPSSASTLFSPSHVASVPPSKLVAVLEKDFQNIVAAVPPLGVAVQQLPFERLPVLAYVALAT